MNTAIKSMGGAGKAIKGTGKAAKKAGKEVEGMLMPFDEINQLKLDKGADVPDSPSGGGAGGGGIGGPGMVMPDLATVDMSGINKFKEILSKIFEPFKLAWQKEGQATIDAMKYALTGVWGLVKEIGKSWLEVWTNGTGQAILETMLRILQNIFNTIGDIARSFTKAWTQGGLGTSIMQHIHNIILHILTLIERLTGAFREVWGEVGDRLARIFLETLDNILATLDHLGKKLVWVWDNGGEHLFQGFVRLGAKILELAMFILNELVLPFVNWFIDLMAPAVAAVMDAVGWLFDKFSELIDWLMGDGKPVLDIIVTVLGSMAVAFGIVKGAILTFNTVIKTAKIVTGAFKAAIAAVTSPIGIAVLAIGGAIAIGVLLYKNWDKISAWLKKTWEGIKEKAVEIWGSIKEFFIKIWNEIKDIANLVWEKIQRNIMLPILQAKVKLQETWKAIKEYILKKWNEIRQGISNMKNNLVNAIKEPFNIAKDWINGIIKNAKNWGRNLIRNFIDGINAMIGKVKDAVGKVANTVKDFLGFSSPAKKGPGAEADKWMPNLMDMLAKGIEDNIYEVSAAVSMTARNIKQGMQPNADDMASAVGSAVLQSMQIAGNNQDYGDTTIEFKIDGSTFARVVMPYLDKEEQRIGNPAIKPI